MELIFAAVPAVLALAWLALREIAPKTPTKLDDKFVSVVEEAVKRVQEKKNG